MLLAEQVLTNDPYVRILPCVRPGPIHSRPPQTRGAFERAGGGWCGCLGEVGQLLVVVGGRLVSGWWWLVEGWALF